jgi:hypothetical protein
MPKDVRHIRYLLYATHAFLTEPLLAVAVGQNDLLALAHLLCEFSMQLDSLEFQDSLKAIGFVLVAIVSQMELFEALLEFIDERIEELTQDSFACHLFSTCVALLAVSFVPLDLNRLRRFAKEVIGRPNLAKDDLRASLCRSLLAEIVALEQQNLLVAAQNPQLQLQLVKEEIVVAEKVKKSEVVNEKMILFSILKKLTRNQTRTEGLYELIRFDDGSAEDVVGVIGKLIPSVKKDVDELRKVQHNKRKVL